MAASSSSSSSKSVCRPSLLVKLWQLLECAHWPLYCRRYIEQGLMGGRGRGGGFPVERPCFGGQCLQAVVAGEALVTVGVRTLASLLQEVRMSL